MSVSLNLANIADAISQISVSGVTVKDVNQLSASWAPLPNVLYPNDENWITGFSIEYKAIIRGAAAPANFRYTLNYRFLGTQVGDMATMPTAYSNLVDKVIAIVNAIFSVDAPYNGSVDMAIGDIDVGPKTDPAGNQYFGADFALNVEEIQN
jgi:hypothetical protein